MILCFLFGTIGFTGDFVMSAGERFPGGNWMSSGKSAFAGEASDITGNFPGGAGESVASSTGVFSGKLVFPGESFPGKAER